METLSSRQQSILNRVVEIHIETAQPVGSHAITRIYTDLYHISYSSATVRHEMGALEEGGYLTHPHTSAGRIPTDRGYRYYVDHGLCQETFPQDFLSSFADDLLMLHEESESFAEKVSRILSSLSEEASLVVVPDLPSHGFERSGRMKLFLQGSSRILEKPEFQDIQKIRALFMVFEEKARLTDWLVHRASGEGVFVTIGHENDPEALQDCAVISARYSAGEHHVGTLAILGPKRMRYSRTVPLVAWVARLIGRVLAQRSPS